MSRSSETEYIKLKGTELRQTDKAVHFLVERVGDDELENPVSHWFPISQIKSRTIHPETEGSDMIEVASWICRAKELV